MGEESFQSRQSQPPIEAAPGEDPLEARVVCPCCCKATDSLKAYRLLNVVYVLVYVVWNQEQWVACPACMRRRLLTKMGVEIVFANVLFPFVGAVYLVQFLATYRTGHSSAAVAESFAFTPDEHLGLQQKAVNLRKPPRREWIVLAIVLFLVAGVWVGGYVFKTYGPEPTQDGRPLTDWVNGLDAQNPLDRERAAAALHAIGPRASRAVPRLQQAARTDPSFEVRVAAYLALSRIDPDAVRNIPAPPGANLFRP